MSTEPTTVQRGRWFPEMPPALPDETDEQYTNRLTGADRTGRVPYDHSRNRQCSLGWHNECSDPTGTVCECPCHRVVAIVEAFYAREAELVALAEQWMKRRGKPDFWLAAGELKAVLERTQVRWP